MANGILVLIIFSTILLPLQIYIGTNGFKDQLVKILGDFFMKHFYRFFYILITLAIYVFLLWYYATKLPEPTPIFSFWIFDREQMSGSIPYLVIDTIWFIAAFLILEALWEMELLEFLGLKQLFYFFNRKKKETTFVRNRLREQEYVPKGLYLRHRQPLFFYVVMFILLSRVISINTFLFLLIFVTYYHFSSKKQEERLIEDYGDSYKKYYATVRKYWPMFKRYITNDKPKK